MTPSTTTKTRTDSTDRNPALPASTSTARRSKPQARLGVTARRLLNNLMRSLASPHI